MHVHTLGLHTNIYIGFQANFKSNQIGFIKSIIYFKYGSQSKHGSITKFCFNVGLVSNTIDLH